MRIVLSLLGIVLFVGCNVGLSPSREVPPEQQVLQKTASFISSLGNAGLGQEGLRLAVTPGSGMHNPAIAYNEAVKERANELALYTGAFVSK